MDGCESFGKLTLRSIVIIYLLCKFHIRYIVLISSAKLRRKIGWGNRLGLAFRIPNKWEGPPSRVPPFFMLDAQHGI